MNCIEEGRLRAWLDHELDPEPMRQVADHLQRCAHCGAAAERLAQRSGRLAQWLETGESDAAGQSSLTESALLRWRSRRMAAMAAAPAKIRWWRAAWLLSPRTLATAAALLVVVVISSSTVGRAWAARVLEMLRVQKVTAIPVDSAVFSSPQGKQAGQMLDQLISSSLVVTMKPGQPLPVSSAAAASQAAGFAVRLPAGLPAPARLLVHGEAAFQMTLDRSRLQAILDEAGRSDLQLPADVQNALIAVHVPHLVSARYGACPAASGSSGPGGEGRHRGAYPGCTILMQVPSPTVSVPPDLNLQQMAAVGLQLTGMSPSQAETLVRSIDWTSTLVIPVPERIANSQTVSVDGQTGVLILQQRNPSASGYNLVWTRKGIVYSISGWGDSAQALQMADSLQ